jgi:sortase A
MGEFREFGQKFKGSSPFSIQRLRDRRFFSRPALAFALVVIGLCLLGYVSFSYFRMYWEQRRLASEWAIQQQPTELGETSAPDDGLTRVSIPKIDLDAIIIEGTSRKQLALGPGHMESTALPGEAGNSVITAHRDTFFRHIYELNKGDEIRVSRSGRTFTYQVTGKKIVQPSDNSVLAPSSDAKLTLITCYPTYYIGPAPERLVVFSKLVESSPAREKAQGGSSRPSAP